MTLLTPPRDLTAAYMRRLQRIRKATTAAAFANFARVTPASAGDYVDSVVPIVLSGQATTVATVDAYLSLVAGAATDTSTQPVGIDPAEIIGAKARNGTPLETVYHRPFWEWERRQRELFDAVELPSTSIRRATGVDREQLRLYARSRIAQDIITDLQLVQRDAAWARIQIDPRLPRWRRVLTGAENCPLCATAATQTYTKVRRIQLHPGCDCGIEPVIDGDALAVPNVSALPAVYERMAQMRVRGSGISRRTDVTGPVTLHPDRLNARFDPQDMPPVEVVEHGELGPLLWPTGQHFTGPDDI
jgi:hypothetical protein